jgi:hypothetical protein
MLEDRQIIRQSAFAEAGVRYAARGARRQLDLGGRPHRASRLARPR